MREGLSGIMRGYTGVINDDEKKKRKGYTGNDNDKIEMLCKKDDNATVDNILVDTILADSAPRTPFAAVAPQTVILTTPSLLKLSSIAVRSSDRRHRQYRLAQLPLVVTTSTHQHRQQQQHHHHLLRHVLHLRPYINARLPFILFRAEKFANILFFIYFFFFEDKNSKNSKFH